MIAKKNDWVQIYFIGLSPEERANNLPEDTKRVPLEIRIKGFLLADKAEIGDEVEIETPVGRIVKGKLEEIYPKYKHNFGKPVIELLQIGKQLREMIEGDQE
ncbi:2-amino-4-ketopentanoate thiolase subunit alpha [Marinitoga sp. 1197]|uniref:2-amino-4-oxopentanoate thiolase subunit OrtA n=1 Tax=Marinitoga sp. 1197 TaxID=1428449 RepID=UPI0006416ED4|nr:2-amino-4-oxopentanoate thiolase subunit OrtA [Marinitoga sp. 1197]KLO22574.1 2-amino-4-ketopentanoate thiolase subunit alpha [Marinitoga sp. 1197]